MPTTPVGQLPYPQGTDPPVIPTDMQALAAGFDGWVSAQDAALQGRLAAVSSRLSAVSTRLATVNSAVTVANTGMTAGDTAIASAQSAQNAVLTRLTTQDTAASTLQARYNNDNAELSQFRNFTPLGSTGALSSSTNVSNDASGAVFWLGSFNFTVNAPAPVWRVTFCGNAQIASSDTAGRVELRVCAGSPSVAWASFTAQAFLARQNNSGYVPFSVSTTVAAGVLRNVPVQIALGAQGTAGYRISATVQNATLQYLQSGGF
jgi:hypothetical protein